MKQILSMEEKSYVIDTSVIIEGLVSNFIKGKKIKGNIIIPKAVLAELEHQANQGQEIGYLGLEELQSLQKLAKEEKIKLSFTGERPNIYQITNAKTGGEVDALIRDIAYSEGAILITADKVQSESAKALGMEVLYCHHEEIGSKLEVEKYFDSTTMSVHLKEGCLPKAKKGKPGEWSLLDVGTSVLQQSKIQEIAKEIVERSRIEPDAFIEISRPGSTIVQYKDYRIVISKPPVSDGWEITAVKPIKVLKLEDYNLPDKIAERVKIKARGVVIAGTTGSGKCLPKNTIVYLRDNIIKNIEDVKIGDEVLTYGKDCKVTSNKVTKTFDRKSKTILLKTNFGKEIELTPEHPVLSFKDGIPQWVQANDLNIGSRIASIRKLDDEGRIQKIDWVKLLPEKQILVKLNKDVNLKIPVEETLFGLKKKIFQVIKYNGKLKLNDIHKLLKSYSELISYNLPILVKDGLINREGKVKNYLYSVNKEVIKLKKNYWLSLEIIKKYLSDEEIYNNVDEIKKFDTTNNSHICLAIRSPKYLTKELCELLGYYIGECLTKHEISTDSEYYRNRFKELSKNIFNIELEKGSKRGYDIYTDKYGTIELFLNKCFGISLLKSKKRATYHKLPQLILNSPKIELASFLRAYFDTKSYVHPQKGIEISSASISLIKSTQFALLRFNIQSTIRTKIIKNKPYYILYIYGYENIKRFGNEIGYVEKKLQFEDYIKNNKSGSPNKDTIPIGILLDNLNKREQLGIKCHFLDRDFSHKQANKMLTLISNQIQQEQSLIEVAMIELASSEYIQWDKITNIIEFDEEKEVYDIEIEDTHNFLAGDVPFIVHNSTFCQSLGEYYALQKYIVKTVESPRSLILSKEITQYSKNLASSDEIHDILFLSRPDYILFDEMRNTSDFELYTDLRLGGSNVLGVLHSATPIDAVQRFISRLEVGMIPSVLDTLIFIDKGQVGKILTIQMKVKVPSGMVEADLARPVVEVHDYLTNKLEFEIYSYGEETVVIPVEEDSENNSDPSKKLAAKHIQKELRKYVDEVEVKVIGNNRAEIYIPESEIARIIGKEGKTINQIEKDIGIKLDVKSMTENKKKFENSIDESDRQSVKYNIEESKKALIFKLEQQYAGYQAEIYIDSHFLLTYTIGKSSEIKINKKSKLGRELIKDLNSHRKIEIRI